MDAYETTAVIRARQKARALEARERRAFLYGGVVVGLTMVLLFVSALLYAQTIPPDAGRYKRDLIREARGVWGMNAPVATLAAQIHQESAWRADARSRVGAQGLTQFMPATATWIAAEYPVELGQLDVYNPQWAMRAQSVYMRRLHAQVDAVDECERMAFALSSYNGGAGWMFKRKRLSPTPRVCLFATCEINPGITAANQRENSQYPRRILLHLEPVYKAQAWGVGSCST